MAVQARPTDVTATVTLWVPLDASGDLTSGVENVLGDVDGVDGLEVYDVADVQPRATDIQVTAVVGARLVVPAVEDAGETLSDGFGVMAVDRIETEA
jgi:copper chaperone CopZ